jgi:hypothetical protein
MSQDKNEPILIRRKGGTITFWKIIEPEDIKPEKPETPPSRKEKGEKLPFAEQSWKRQVAYRKRTITRLLELLYTIENPLQLFVSLNLDSAHRDISGADFKRLIRKFCRALGNRYLDGWAAYRVEWSNKSGLHFHLLGALSDEPVTLDMMDRYEKQLERLWNKVCSKEKIKCHTVKVTPAVEEHRTYMTQPGKFKEDLECMKRLNGKNMFGVINKKNIRYYEDITDVLSAEEFFKLIAALCKEDEGKVHTDFYTTQASHKRGAIRRLDEKALTRIFNEIKNGEGGTP